MICQIHGIPMEQKIGQYGPYWSHTTADGYCNGTTVKPFKNRPVQPGQVSQVNVSEAVLDDRPERKPRIERQHSQDMAIQWMKLEADCAATPYTPSLERLKELTDYFEKDIGESE